MIKISAMTGSITAATDEQETLLNGKRVTQVHDGKVVVKEFRVRKKRKMSSQQRMALQKAQKKAHSAQADKKRNVSMKVRNRVVQGMARVQSASA